MLRSVSPAAASTPARARDRQSSPLPVHPCRRSFFAGLQARLPHDAHKVRFQRTAGRDRTFRCRRRPRVEAPPARGWAFRYQLVRPQLPRRAIRVCAPRVVASVRTRPRPSLNRASPTDAQYVSMVSQKSQWYLADTCAVVNVDRLGTFSSRMEADPDAAL
jgi:hypothetical protein